MNKEVPTFKQHDMLLIDGVEYILGKSYHSPKFQWPTVYFVIRANGVMTPEEIISVNELNVLYETSRLKFTKEA